MRTVPGISSVAAASEPNVSAAPTEIRWLASPDPPPAFQRLLAAWQQHLRDQPFASIYLHPHLALASAGHVSSPPAIFAREGQAGEKAADVATLAVLAPKRVDVRLIPGCRWRIALNGYWLVGNQLLGQCARGATDEFVARLVEFLAAGAAPFIYFDDLAVGSDLWQAVHRAASERRVAVSLPHAPQPHWWIRFPPHADDYWRQMPSKTRRNMRSAARRLEHSVVQYTETRDVPALLEQAEQVSRLSWQGKRLGRVITNTPGYRRFWQAVAEIGALRSYVLLHEGRPAAFVLGSQFSGRLLLEEQGYDPALRERSPGAVLYLRLIEDLIARDTPQLVDFGFGHADYKQWLCNHQTTTGPLLMVRRGIWPSAAVRLEGFSRRASGRLRAWLREWRMAGALRRIYRR